MASEPIVTIAEGRLRGRIFQSRSGLEYAGFLGIPYVNEPQRFQRSVPVDSWEGIKDATEYGDRCIQKDPITKQIWGSENCLTLNIFSPKVSYENGENSEKNIEGLPILVWIHGGAFISGAAQEYDPQYLMENGEVIVITVNYRLGIFGFYNSEDGLTEENLGLKDQLLALKFVQRNAQYFGGDPSKVCLYGQSAGAACVHFHILSPLAKGLFSSAIMQSGSALCPWAFHHHPIFFVNKLSEQLNGPKSTAEMLEFFKSLDCRALAAGDHDYNEWKPKLPLIFGPSLEKKEEGKEVFISDTPWNLINSNNFNHVPILMGVVSEEGLNRAGPVLFSDSLMKRLNENWADMAPLNLMYRTATNVDIGEVSKNIRDFYFGSKLVSMENRKIVIDLFSDRYFFADIFQSARLHAKLAGADNPVYFYMFDYQGENSMLNFNGIHKLLGVCHSDDLQYFFDTTLFPLKLKQGSDSVQVSKNMVKLWSGFATNRNMNFITPENFENHKPWLPISPSLSEEDPIQYYALNTGGEMTLQSEQLRERFAFWEKNLGVTHSA